MPRVTREALHLSSKGYGNYKGKQEGENWVAPSNILEFCENQGGEGVVVFLNPDRIGIANHAVGKDNVGSKEVVT